MTSRPCERLERRPANFQPLTPIGFLERAAHTHPDHIAVIHGARRIAYRELWERCRRLASALTGLGIGLGDTVSVMLANTPPMLEAHYGVPMTGAVLNTLNTRLDAPALAFILDHAETRVLITDLEFSPVISQALARCRRPPLVIDFEDRESALAGERLGRLDYEAVLAASSAEFDRTEPADEWQAISLNYTSGTTGNPKGVVYHHRGAALMGYANVIATGMTAHPVYLWTLPMFHCNGWCFPWSLSVVAGTHVCLRWVRAEAVYAALAAHRVTHLCGAPIVMSTLVNAKPEERRPLPQRVRFVTAAAPPPEAILAAMERAGFAVTHVYGLTETYGPAVVCEWNDAWNDLEPAERAARRARQGVRYPALEGLAVMDPTTMTPVPADGTTIGEVMFRGNIVMKGYLKNSEASEEALGGGWFHSGDLGVLHGDGYIQIKDRSKDIIISGGENISSIEVEDALYKHPAVAAAAVVAIAHEKWGETPCAFVELKPGAIASAAELIEWCRANLAHFKCPSRIVFAELPRTATGKVQKFKLRDAVRAEAAAATAAPSEG